MLTAMLRKTVCATPAKLAIVCGDERIRYDELAGRVQGCAAGLRTLGVGQGDCVAAVLPNGPEFVIAFLASAALRAVFLPLNPQYTKGELQRFIADAQAKIIIAGGASLATCQGLDREPAVPIVAVGGAWPGTIPFGELSGPAAGGASVAASGRDGIAIEPERYAGRALYLYTSGSTGTYKRVCCTQENLYFEARNFVETMQLTADDTILCTIPLFHSYGIGNCLLDALYLGATLVILDQVSAEGQGGDAPFVNHCGRVADLIRRESIRFYPGVPHQFSVLAGLPERFPIDFSAVRFCISSGDVLPRRTYERFLARFGHPIRSLYGSTEAGSIAIDSDPTDRITFGSLGTPLRNVVIEIRAPDGEVLAAGQEGDIWVKSPTLPPAGYDNRPAQTAEAFCRGFYRTGDAGMLERDGRLTMTGRKQSFVDIAGYKVDISEVEEVLHECPGVHEAAALGVTIPNMGTLIKAVVVAKAGWREEGIRTFCRERLAFVKVPRLIELRDRLPRSSTGKVLKNELSDVAPYLGRIRDGRTLKLVERLRGALRERRHPLLRSLVQAQAAAVLGRAPNEIPADRGFTELGMDSFASIELRARLEYLLECELPETLTFDHPTVAAVVEHLLDCSPPSTRADSDRAMATRNTT
jgi:long-chain acyl-CoA synthetase